jgi:hypothetical protein
MSARGGGTTRSRASRAEPRTCDDPAGGKSSRMPAPTLSSTKATTATRPMDRQSMEAGGGLMGVGSERLATAAKQWPDTETASTAERTRPGVLARRERFGGSFSRPRYLLTYW